MSKKELVERMLSCNEQNLCFVTLKPLEGEVVAVFHNDCGFVKVLAEVVIC